MGLTCRMLAAAAAVALVAVTARTAAADVSLAFSLNHYDDFAQTPPASEWRLDVWLPGEAYIQSYTLSSSGGQISASGNSAGGSANSEPFPSYDALRSAIEAGPWTLDLVTSLGHSVYNLAPDFSHIAESSFPTVSPTMPAVPRAVLPPLPTFLWNSSPGIRQVTGFVLNDAASFAGAIINAPANSWQLSQPLESGDYTLWLGFNYYNPVPEIALSLSLLSGPDAGISVDPQPYEYRYSAVTPFTVAVPEPMSVLPLLVLVNGCRRPHRRSA